MEYRKPQLVAKGDANQVVQSAMQKNFPVQDSITGQPLHTSASAYQADE
jgi:hypothetical protein